MIMYMISCPYKGDLVVPLTWEDCPTMMWWDCFRQGYPDCQVAEFTLLKS